MSALPARKRKANEVDGNGHADAIETESLSKAKRTNATAKSQSSLNKVGVRGTCW